jgi:hypothetical protein
MPKQRDDFVLIRPRGGHGSASYHSMGLHVECTREIPAEVTRGEWEAILNGRDIFELCPPTDKEN